MTGNRRLCEETSAHAGRLFPCWIIGPHLPCDFPPEAEVFAEMQARGVRAVRIEPDLMGYSPDPAMWRAWTDRLRASQTLCVFSRLSTANPEAWFALFEGIPLLMVDHSWGEWRRVVRLMQRFPNLHIDFSAFQAHYALEEIAAEFGIERCLFGTGLPERAPGTARGFADFTLLAEADVAAFSHGNLLRLLGNPPLVGVRAKGPFDDLLTAASISSQPIPCPVLDAHCHILADGLSGAGLKNVFPRGDADGMLRLRQRAGIDRTAIMSWEGPLGMESERGNRVVARAVEKYPEHFIGVATYNPEYDTAAELENIIQCYYRTLHFPGLKTYANCQTLEYDDPAFAPWFEYANARGLYLVFDIAGSADRNRVVKNLATRYPKMGLHIDHCGQSWAFAEWVTQVMAEYPNTFAQLNYTSATNGVIEYLVEEVGAARVLFGTDSPMRDPRPQLAWAVFTRLTMEDKQAILGGNFRRILQSIEA